MYKLAQLKEAEVRGTLAALVDNGIVPVDSQDQFEKVAAETVDMLSGYNYDINDVAEASSYALDKVAAEDNAQFALGELTLQKVAGEIDGDAFDYYASAIIKEAAKRSKDFAQLDQALNTMEQKNPSIPRKKKKGGTTTTAPAAEAPSFMSRVKGFGRGALDWATGKDIRGELGKGANRSWKNIGKGAAKGLGVWAPVAAAGYAGYRKFSN